MSQLPWHIQHWTGLKDTLTFLVAASAVCIAARSSWVGLRTYENSVAIKRVESLIQLHKSFFVDPTYKNIRECLDDESEAGMAAQKALVAHHDRESDLIDFLNFFELVAYFAQLEAYKQEDIEAVLGYYLRVIRRPGPIYDYICEKKYSFEHLKSLLDRLGA